MATRVVGHVAGRMPGSVGGVWSKHRRLRISGMSVAPESDAWPIRARRVDGSVVAAGHGSVRPAATPVRIVDGVSEPPEVDREALLRAVRGRPFVAGVGGGVGTTTVARVLDAFDKGVFTGRRPADVLVCRATGDSLDRAVRAAQLIGRDYLRPVLAVSVTDALSPSPPTVARLRLLEPHTSGVVLLPYVRRWRDLTVPLDDVDGLLRTPLSGLPSALRGYAAAARAVSAALDGASVNHPSLMAPLPRRPGPSSNRPVRRPER